MVDPDRLHRLLQRVSADVAVLSEYGERPAEVLHDRAKLGDVKYTFITALEGVINAAQHVCAADDLGAPDTNADAVRLLARASLLDGELAERLASAVGFRNLLVHGYADVDDRRVVQHLEALDDLRSFVRALTALL